MAFCHLAINNTTRGWLGTY